MSIARPVQIVGLNGSPHRQGNTATLMGWVLEGCTEAGAEVSWLHGADLDIRYCRGCMTCLRTGACVIQDGFAGARDRLLAADGIVVGAPVYADAPPAQFKTFLDRLTLLNLHTRLFERQYSVGVATSGIAPFQGVARGLAVMFGWPCGTIGAKCTTIARGYQPLAEAHDRRLPERARALGRRLVGSIRTPARQFSLAPGYLMYLLLKRLAIRPLVMRNPEQYAGVLRIWQEKGQV